MISLALLTAVTLGADTLTGDWNGAREELEEDLGLTLDVAYTAETWFEWNRREAVLLGHIDLALGFDTGKAGLWPGGKLYVLGQASHGNGVNTLVGSANEVSNLEARQFTQVAEIFYEQLLWDERVKVRLGRQDANRDFGTPRYGGNFINNNFGMYPTAPLPSYPTTGLGATVTVDPLTWLSIRGALYQGDPLVGSFDIPAEDGAIGIFGVALKHVFGSTRHGGTTGAAAWAHTDGRWGLMFQNDERIYSHPDDPDDGRGLNLITRLSISPGGDIPLYVGASLAWHGIWARDNDTVGAGFGYFTLQSGGSETFIEIFYKLRVTRWFSLQPDVQFYRTPGGDAGPGQNAFLTGLRAKLKL